MTKLLMAATAALVLSGCDAATQIAGEAVEGEVRTAVVDRCQQLSESAGLVADRVNEVCECSADRFLADPDLTMADVSRENIEGIINQCTADTASDMGKGSINMPAEEIGG